MKRSTALTAARALMGGGSGDPVIGGGLPKGYSGSIVLKKKVDISHPEPVGNTDSKWIPTFWETESGSQVRISAMQVCRAEGLIWDSGYLADRLGSLATMNVGDSIDVSDYRFEEVDGANGKYTRKTLVCDEGQTMPSANFESEDKPKAKRGKK